MDEKKLKEMLSVLGVDASGIAPERFQEATKIFESPNQNRIKEGLTSRNQGSSDDQAFAATEDRISQLYAATPTKFTKTSKEATRQNNKLFASIRKSQYEKAGLDDPLADQYKEFLTNNNRTLADYQRDNAAAQERMGARETAQAERAASLSPSAAPDDVKSGDPFKSFRDESGALEGPKQLKERLIREGGKGYDRREADKAAGARFNAMFRDNSAVKNAAPEDRMAVMQGLKDARKDALTNLSEQRKNDPNSKPIGRVTSIQDSSGNALMQRGASDFRSTKFGMPGALKEVPGKMELTPAGERAIRDRSTSAQVPASELTGFSPSADRDAGGQQVNVVAGRNTTAIGGLSIVDQLKSKGTLPKDFQLTDKMRVGEEALPDAYVKGRDEILANARGIAQERGQVSNPATRMAMANTSPDKIASIDNAAVAEEKAAAVEAEVARGDAALRGVYSPDQMKSLDKTIAKAVKTGKTVFDRGGGNFGVRPTTQKDEDLKRRLMQGGT
jgi:hypothetical protein